MTANFLSLILETLELNIQSVNFKYDYGKVRDMVRFIVILKIANQPTTTKT